MFWKMFPVLLHLCFLGLSLASREQEMLDNYSRIAFGDAAQGKGSGTIEQDEMEVSLAEGYKLLSKRLESQVTTIDLEKNVQVAKQWLESLEGQFKEVELALVLEYFVALGRLLDDKTKCTEKAEEILKTNDYLTNGRASDTVNYGDERLDRASLLVRKSMQKHARECEQFYIEKYKQIMTGDTMSQATKDELKDGVLSLGLVVRLSSNPRLLFGLSRLGPSPNGAPEGREAMKALSEALAMRLLRRVDHDEKPQEGGFSANIQKYVLKPCGEYIDSLEHTVFLPASMDVSNDFKLKLLSSKMSDELAEFYLALGRYKICKSLTSHRKEFGEQISEAYNKLKS